MAGGEQGGIVEYLTFIHRYSAACNCQSRGTSCTTDPQCEHDMSFATYRQCQNRICTKHFCAHYFWDPAIMSHGHGTKLHFCHGTRRGEATMATMAHRRDTVSTRPMTLRAHKSGPVSNVPTLLVLALCLGQLSTAYAALFTLDAYGDAQCSSAQPQATVTCGNGACCSFSYAGQPTVYVQGTSSDSAYSITIYPNSGCTVGRSIRGLCCCCFAI
jgi:hypothetical protein